MNHTAIRRIRVKMSKKRGVSANPSPSGEDLNKTLQQLAMQAAQFREKGEPGNEAIVLTQMAGVYKRLGDCTAALDRLEQALNCALKQNDQKGLIYIRHNIATICLEINHTHRFLEYETDAFMAALSLNDAPGIFHTARDLGHYLCKTGFIHQGLPLLEKSAEIGKKESYPGLAAVNELISLYASPRQSITVPR